MKLHHLVQGSAPWHAHRRGYRNASDTPAMLGASPYRSRGDLIRWVALGIDEDHSEHTQALLADGHRTEALARPIGSRIIGEALYPAVGSEGRYSASFDGLTMDDATTWEHKKLNQAIRDAFAAIDQAIQAGQDPAAAVHAHLPLVYRSQMEHQLMVAGATRCLFSATDWDGDVLREALHTWYTPDLELRARIVAGWDQFDVDVQEFRASAAAGQVRDVPAAPAMLAPAALPALILRVTGEVISSNLPAFRVAAEQFLASIPADLKTDQDFGQAEQIVKACERGEKMLDDARTAALSQTVSLDQLLRDVEAIRESLRQARLNLTKRVDRRKEDIKTEIIVAALDAWRNHVAALEVATFPIALQMAPPSVAAAAKGKRTMETYREAVDTCLASAKAEATMLAQQIEARRVWFKQAAGGRYELFADLQALILKREDEFKALVLNRIAEAEKAEGERAALAAAAAAVAAVPADPLPMPAADPAPAAAPAPAVVSIPTGQTQAPTLKLGQINDRLGLTMTAAFVRDVLGARATEEGSARLYTERDFQWMCSRLAIHAAKVAAQHAAKASEQIAA